MGSPRRAVVLMGEDHSEDRVTVWASSDLVERMDDRINWRYESRSQWVREAIETRLVLEDALGAQGVDLPDDADDRAALVEQVVRAGVAAAGDELTAGEE